MCIIVILHICLGYAIQHVFLRWYCPKSGRDFLWELEWSLTFMEKGLLAKLNHLIFKVAVDVDFFPDTHRTFSNLFWISRVFSVIVYNCKLELSGISQCYHMVLQSMNFGTFEQFLTLWFLFKWQKSKKTTVLKLNSCYSIINICLIRDF